MTTTRPGFDLSRQHRLIRPAPFAGQYVAQDRHVAPGADFPRSLTSPEKFSLTTTSLNIVGGCRGWLQSVAMSRETIRAIIFADLEVGAGRVEGVEHGSEFRCVHFSTEKIIEESGREDGLGEVVTVHRVEERLNRLALTHQWLSLGTIRSTRCKAS